MLAPLGRRLRAARQARGASRSALARSSGLSPRFLAEVESGAANISVLRLRDVLQALDLTWADVFQPEDGASGPGVPARGRRPVRDGQLEPRIDALLAGRSQEELSEVLEWLSARFAATTGPLVALLGLRGAGKTHVGARLARLLGVGFFELDSLVEEAAGLRLEQIFELQGPARYRQLERDALRRFLARTSTGVVATGGGIVTEPETFALLRRRCLTVWLRARPEEHWERVVRQGDPRPMRGNPAAMHELRALLAAREPLYRQAHLAVDTSGRTAVQVARTLAALVRRHAGGAAP